MGGGGAYPLNSRRIPTHQTLPTQQPCLPRDQTYQVTQPTQQPSPTPGGLGPPTTPGLYLPINALPGSRPKAAPVVLLGGWLPGSKPSPLGEGQLSRRFHLPINPRREPYGYEAPAPRCQIALSRAAGLPRGLPKRPPVARYAGLWRGPWAVLEPVLGCRIAE